MKITAEFVTSAGSAEGFPADRLPEIALVGRSNVGKSSLINALTRQRVARTSAAPGKTRLANIYRVRRGGGAPLYLVDLPGYGYARGGTASAREFDELTRAYFGSVRLQPDVSSVRLQPDVSSVRPQPDQHVAAILLVDSRHPGLASDVDAWRWLQQTVAGAAIVATKIDKLPRGQRIRATRELESVLEHPVLPVSAVTGEGLEELWKLIDRLANNRNPQPPSNRPSSPPRPGATAPRPAKKGRSRPRR